MAGKEMRILIGFIIILGMVMAGDMRSEACNVAVVTAQASATGRPFLWKNRDHADSIRQELVYYPQVKTGIGGSIRMMGETTYNTNLTVCTGGANESGFAIANTTCYESAALELNNVNTNLMEAALEECRTLSDFEQNIIALFTTRWAGKNISGIFGAIDAYGGAAIYEMWTNGNGNPIMYRKFNANNGSVTNQYGQPAVDYTGTNTVGFVNRTNSNHTIGWINIWSDTPRELRGRQLMTELLANDDLSPRTMMRDISKDVCGGTPSTYCLDSNVRSDWNFSGDTYLNPNRDGEMYTRYCISRYQTSMGLVIEGASSPDEVSLTTVWGALCEPSLSIFIPYFPFSGITSPYAHHNQHTNTGYYWDGISSSSDTNASSFMNLLFDCVQTNPFSTSYYPSLNNIYKNISLYTNNGLCSPWPCLDGYGMDRTINYPRLMALQHWTLPLEDFVFDRTEEFLSVLRDYPYLITPGLLEDFSEYCNRYVYANYSHQSDGLNDASMLWSYDMPVGDGEAPEISQTSIQDNDTDVPVNSVISVVFSEPLNAATINTASFTLYAGAQQVNGTVTYSAATQTAIFRPANVLVNDTTYTATLTDDIEDLAGNSLAGGYIWSFTTVSPTYVDNTPPLIISTSIANNAENIPTGSTVTVTFNEDMNAASITDTEFSLLLYKGIAQVEGAVIYNSVTLSATFIPNSSLSYNTWYTFVVSSTIEDQAGNNLVSDHSLYFKTQDLTGIEWNYTPEDLASVDPDNNYGNYTTPAKSDSAGGCGSYADASTFAGGPRPALPGLISLLVTMIFPFGLMSAVNIIKRKRSR